MEIRSQSKLLGVLQEYPFLEEIIIGIAPPFKNLKNPVLRRTVGQLATVEKVAQIGNIEVSELVNTLRRAAGQPELGADAAAGVAVPEKTAGDPDWIAGEPQFIVDGTEMLKQGEVPLVRVNELLGQLTADGYILLVTDFEPLPIMETMRKRDKRIFHKLHPENAGTHLTYIQ
jgi:hypothetical protein